MKKTSITILLFIIVYISSSAQSLQTFRLDNLSVSDGLPNSSVSKITQDDSGFMWIGTQSGLTRYDGRNFKTFLNDPFNINSIPHNQIQTMYLDKEDKLWLGTYNGLSQLDLNTYTFDNFLSIAEDNETLSNDVVVAIERDSRGRLWVGTLDGLNLYDENTRTFTRFHNDPDDKTSLPNNTVRSIFKDNNDNLWIGTYGGLSRWDNESKNFINYGPVENDPNSIPSVYIMDITQSPYSDDVIIIGSWGGGITEFNTLTKSSYTYDIPDKRVYSMLVDDQDRLWAGTWGSGLVIVTLGEGSFQHYEKGVSSDLSHNIIYSLYKDFSGVIWIGTNGGGINKYVDWKNQYQFYINQEKNPESIPSGRIQVAYEDSKSRLWFSVVGKGISRFIPETGKFINYEHDENNFTTLSNTTVNSIYEDSQENLWIGTNNGLNRYVEESDNFERIISEKDDSSLPENLIFSIIEDQEQNLWFGSYTTGLSVLDKETGKYRYYKSEKGDPTTISDNLIRDLYIDSFGKLWIGTNKGLNLYIPESDSFKSFLHDNNDRGSISSNDIRKIFEDSVGNLWIATNGGGVNLYNRSAETFSLLSTTDGLLNNSVYGIEEDDKGNILFITEIGISLYNKRDKSFSVIDEKTGLLSNELSAGFLKASDGSFYIGSNEGITHIPYFEEQFYSYKPMIHINSFSILGVPYENSNNPIWKTEEVVLKHQENILSFEFTLSDYSSEGQNQFAYKLEGVDKDWVYSGVRNYARYTQLKPGQYIFRVIGGDSRNNWNNKGTSLKLTILPPFWLSKFAYISYSLVIFLIIVLILLRIKRKQFETKNKIEEQKTLNLELENRVRKRTAQIEEARKVAEDATRAKSLFLANMSHELRTPLNAVVGFSALLNEGDYSDDKKHIISSIKTAGRNLSTLINDLLDLSKLEAGKLVIQYSPVDIANVLYEIKHMFVLRVKEKDLILKIDQDRAIPRELMLDETRFRQILINLTSNALKFTNEGIVKITVTRLENNKDGVLDLKIVIQDSGTGIDEHEQKKIFDIFWQSENKEMKKSTGTGLGLSITKNLVSMMNGEISMQSISGEGTIFTVIFHDVIIPPSSGLIKPRLNSSDPIKDITFNGIKALIVDDIEDNRNLLIEIMKTINISCAFAANGVEAIKQTDTFNPDIIFMDLRMPLMDGSTAAKKIKSNPLTRQIPIVAVSASSETEILDCFEDYITKPYSLKNVIDVLKKQLSFHTYTVEKDEPSQAMDYHNEKISDLEGLLILLEDYKDEWKQLKPSGRMSVLENFSLRVRDMGILHNAGAPIAYAEKLLTYIKQFDLYNIEKELARYPEMIESLKN